MGEQAQTDPTAGVPPEIVVALDEAWSHCIGNSSVVQQMRRAAAFPNHAYLLIGPSGVGSRQAARSFAADLLARSAKPALADRQVRLALAEQHPALVVFERVGASISADQAREIQRRAQLSPPEGSVQVLLLTDFHLVSSAAPILLKSIEEPPPGTIFIILADHLTPELTTIASRCVQFEFHPLSDGEILEELHRCGLPSERARAVCRVSGGSLERARLLATDDAVMARQEFWRGLPDHLAGTGSSAYQQTLEAIAQIDTVLEPLAASHTAEVAAFAQQIELTGQKKTAQKELDARHARERRRVRSDELSAGLAALMDRYRAEGVDRPELYLRAASEVAQFERSLAFNPSEELALAALLLRLPLLRPK